MPANQFRDMFGKLNLKLIFITTLFIVFIAGSALISRQPTSFAAEPRFSKSTAATNEWTAVKSGPISIQATAQPAANVVAQQQQTFRVFLPVIYQPRIYTPDGILLIKAYKLPPLALRPEAVVQATLTPPNPTPPPGSTPVTPVATPLPGEPTFTVTPKASLTPTPTNTPTPVTIPQGDFEDLEGTGGRWRTFSLRGHRIIFDSSVDDNLPELPINPTSGDAAVWLGGDDSELSYIEGLVAIPNSHPYLAHRYYIYSPDPVCATDLFSDNTVATQFRFATAGSLDNLQSDVGGLIVTSDGDVAVYVLDLCTSEATGGWGTIVYDTSFFAGRFVTIQLKTIGDSQVSSSFFIDDLVLTHEFVPFFRPAASQSEVTSFEGNTLPPTVDVIKPIIITDQGEPQTPAEMLK